MLCPVIFLSERADSTAGLFYGELQPGWLVQFIRNEVKDGATYSVAHDGPVVLSEAHLGSFATQQKCVRRNQRSRA